MRATAWPRSGLALRVWRADVSPVPIACAGSRPRATPATHGFAVPVARSASPNPCNPRNLRITPPCNPYRRFFFPARGSTIDRNRRACASIPLGRETLDARRAEEAGDARRALEHVLRVLGLGDRAAVAEHDDVGLAPRSRRRASPARASPPRRAISAVFAPIDPLRGQSHVRDERRRRRPRAICARAVRVEDVGAGEHARVVRASRIMSTSSSKLMPVSSRFCRNRPSIRPTVGKFCTPSKPIAFSSRRKTRIMRNGIGAADAGEHRRVLHDRQHLARHVDDDRVGVAVGHHPGRLPRPAMRKRPEL